MPRRRTSDEFFASGIFAQLGSVATLPDNSELRVILHSDASGVVTLGVNLYIDGEWIKFLAREQGTLRAEQIITIGGVGYFVQSIGELGAGWKYAALTRS